MRTNSHIKTDRHRGFTLVELLVVLLIVVLVSAATLPVVIPAFNHRQVSEGARILHATLAGARDSAIRANAPRGIRLLPDPAFPGPNTLAANRMVALEAAADYNSGLVSIGLRQRALPGALTTLTLSNGQVVTFAQEIVIREELRNASNLLNEPTSWYWNVRQGEKIRFDDSGRYYTIVGPMLVGPTGGNTERYINFGPPGSVDDGSGNPVSNNGVPFSNRGLEYLIVTNGQDDNGNGFVDESFDGIDNDGDGVTDPAYDGSNPALGHGLLYNGSAVVVGEYEVEKLVGSQFAAITVFTPPVTHQTYNILRRPVVTESSHEVALPQGVVVDLTTWNTTLERSRLPIDPFTGFVDIMIYPNGQVVIPGPGQGSLPTAGNALSSMPFYHFWIAERDDVFDAQGTTFPALPMPAATPGYAGAVNLKGDRRLVTLFTRTGQVVTNEIENFNAADRNTPYYAAQFGLRESK